LRHGDGSLANSPTKSQPGIDITAECQAGLEHGGRGLVGQRREPARRSVGQQRGQDGLCRPRHRRLHRWIGRPFDGDAVERDDAVVDNGRGRTLKRRLGVVSGDDGVVHRCL
jgi:hypothetical protein